MIVRMRLGLRELEDRTRNCAVVTFNEFVTIFDFLSIRPPILYAYNERRVSKGSVTHVVSFTHREGPLTFHAIASRLEANRKVQR